jgi:hypothetical protein
MPKSSRFLHPNSTLERRAGAWLRDFNVTVARPEFSIAGHLAELAVPKLPSHDGRL